MLKFFTRKTAHAQSMEKKMKSAALSGVEFLMAQDRSLKLDFSEASLGRLEQFVAANWDSGTVPGDEQITQVGAYVGEVVRKEMGGYWFVDPNTRQFAVGWPKNNLVALPVHKVRNRLSGLDPGPLGDYLRHLRNLRGDAKPAKRRARKK